MPHTDEHHGHNPQVIVVQVDLTPVLQAIHHLGGNLMASVDDVKTAMAAIQTAVDAQAGELTTQAAALAAVKVDADRLVELLQTNPADMDALVATAAGIASKLGDSTAALQASTAALQGIDAEVDEVSPDAPPEPVL